MSKTHKKASGPRKAGSGKRGRKPHVGRFGWGLWCRIMAISLVQGVGVNEACKRYFAEKHDYRDWTSVARDFREAQKRYDSNPELRDEANTWLGQFVIMQITGKSFRKIADLFLAGADDQIFDDEDQRKRFWALMTRLRSRIE